MTEIPNWFINDAIKNFSFYLPRFTNKETKILQIGAYSGDASEWISKNITNTHEKSFLVDVDTWEGSDEPLHKSMDWKSVENIYDEKTKEYKELGKIKKFKGTSDEFFKTNEEVFDFIYIDGDHTSYGVLKDAINSYECLSINGIVAFDDYRWSANLGPLKEPKAAIDSFFHVYQDRIDIMFKDYQAWYRKVR
jgi:hypothetical protein